MKQPYSLPHKRTLLAYSTAALGVAVPTATDAQAVYTDLDPDLVLNYVEGDSYVLDLNGDGFDDLLLEGVLDTTYLPIGTTFYTFDTFKLLVTPLEDAGVFLGAGWDYMEFPGAWIDEGPGDMFVESYPVIFKARTNDMPLFMGFSIQEDDGTHYGWLRLTGDAEGVVLLDHALEASPETAIYAQRPGGPVGVSDIVVADVGNTHSIEDVQVSFTVPEDESGIAAYRIFAGSAVWDPFSAVDAIPQQYLELTPDGNDKEVHLEAGMLGYMMDTLEEFDLLYVFVQSVGAAEPMESVLTNTIHYVVPGHPVSTPEIYSFDIGPAPAPWDAFKVNMRVPDDMHGITRFFTYIVPAADMPIADTADLCHTGYGFSVSAGFAPGGDFTPGEVFDLPMPLTDMHGDEVLYEQDYAVCVRSATQWSWYSDFAYEQLTCTNVVTLEEQFDQIAETPTVFSAVHTPGGIYIETTLSEAVVYVYGISGQRVSAAAIHGTTQIPVELPAGFYLLEVQAPGYRGVQKLVVD